MDNALWYSLLVSLFVAIVVVSSYISKRKRRKKLMDKVEKQWGMDPNTKYKESDMLAISGYFNNRKEMFSQGIYIDDITWNDLDMDNVYKRINSTLTSTGEEYLYSMLREPVFDEESINERNRLIRIFQQNKDLRKRMQMPLAQLGKKRDSYIPEYLFNDGFVKLKGTGQYIFLALLPLVIIAVAIAGNIGAFLLLPVIMMINMTIYHSRKNIIEKDLEMLSYLVGIVRCAKKMSSVMDESLSEYKNKLDKYLKKVGPLERKSVNLLYKTSDPLMEYAKVLFLAEIISFEKSFTLISKYKAEIHEIYKIVGLMDSLISIASYRRSVLYYCVPKMEKKDKTAASINAVDVYHPLLSSPIANSIYMDKPVLLTGSNASGKSTFLKTIAVNALFAQTIATCLAKEYSSAIFMLYSSMALKDSIKDGESYYISEIKSLKRILDKRESKVPILCIIDEVLRGTNTIERISASSEVLALMAEEKFLCMAATHDLELSIILGEKYDNYHFQESFKDNDIVFDYKLYEGKSNTRNAIKLLAVMGYSPLVVENASKRAQKFMETGNWTS